jgi:hypothetical protein
MTSSRIALRSQQHGEVSGLRPDPHLSWASIMLTMLWDSSWLSRATASTQRFLSESTHELPRWRSPSPMRASMIPPPIVQSGYAPTPPQTVVKSTIVEQPSPLQDRQSELESDLQFLLDAQAEGLARGFGDGGDDDRSSTGSTTPTAQSVRSASVRRTARPVRKKPGLPSARKGIYNTIRRLSAVTEEELRTIDAEAQDKTETLAQIDEWEKKRAGLQEASKNVDDGEETVRVQRLQQEADTLQEEINYDEMRLAEKKSRHKKMMRQIEALNNQLEAKLASYTSSLSLLEQDVQKFLSLKPVGGDSRPTSRDGKTSIWQLPPKRRTLEMAREQWTEERDSILEQRRGVEHEKQALDEGATVWKDVVTRVSDFENKVRTGIADMASSQSAWEDPPPQPQEQSDRVRELLQQLDSVTEAVESKYRIAEERDWKLLIAAIGAELHALRTGREILEELIPGSEAQQDGLIGTAETTTNGDEAQDDLDEGQEIRDLDKSFLTARPLQSRSATSDSDDDPEPELLFTRQRSAEDE